MGKPHAPDEKSGHRGMKHLFLGVLLLSLTVLLTPSLRHRAQPHIDDGREWLGQQLEGPLSPILIPYRTIQTQTRMGEAIRLLIRSRNRGESAPWPDDFGGYLRAHNEDPADAWGAPLLLVQEPDSVAVISAGPDNEYGTEDDIIEKVRYQAPSRFRIRRR